MAPFIPTCAIIALGIVKEMIAEFIRYNADQKENLKVVQRLILKQPPQEKDGEQGENKEQPDL